MKIGISGISGFVGTNLKKDLSQHYGVYGLSRRHNTHENSFVYENVSDLMAKCDVFIHLAGKAHDLKNTTKSEEYYTINTKLTEKLFDEFNRSSCKIFIYFSSVKAAADQLNEVLTEDYTPNPKTVYGKSKLAAEKYILNGAIADDKKIYILRPCLIHGKNNKGNLKLLHSFVKKGIPYPLGSYENKRSYLSMSNLEFLIRQLIVKQPLSGIYNVSDDDAISTKELVGIISKSISKKTMIWKIPKPLIKILAKIGTLLHLPFNSEKLNKLTENYIVSNDKIKHALKNELPYSTSAGLEKTFSAFNL